MIIIFLPPVDARTPTPEPSKEIASDRNSVESLPSASVISQPDFKSDSFQHIFNQNTNNHSQDDKDAEDEGQLIYRIDNKINIKIIRQSIY